jgi:hypothetical protein
MYKLILGIVVAVLVLIGLSMLIGDTEKETSLIEDSPSESVSIKTEEGVRVAVLAAVDGSTSSGTAYVVRGEGKLTHLVEATMPDPTVGNSYEGWLVDVSTTPLKFFSTGVMSKNDSGIWVLEYEASQEYPSYNRVVITEETKIDAVPEKHIIEGDF